MKTRSAVQTQPSAEPIAGAASQTVHGSPTAADSSVSAVNTGSTASSTARGPSLPSTRPVMSAAAAAPTTETAEHGVLLGLREAAQPRHVDGEERRERRDRVRVEEAADEELERVAVGAYLLRRAHDLAEGVPEEAPFGARRGRRLVAPLADPEERRQREQDEEAPGRREGALLRPVADDALGDDRQREEDPDEAERDGDAGDASAATARRDVGEQRVVLRERELPERDGDAGGDEQRQDVPVGREHLEERARSRRDERERDEERLAAPELVGERAGQRHRDEQEQDDDELRHRHVPVRPAEVVDDPRPEVADDEQEREDRVREVPERPRERRGIAEQIRASRHSAEA